MGTIMNIFEKKLEEKNLKLGALTFLFMVCFTVSAMAQQSVQKTTEELEHNEFMSYVYMALGLIAVICLAWYSTVKGGKKGEKGDQPKNTPHHPVKHHHHHHDHHKK